MKELFSNCYSLLYLPDISKWNISLADHEEIAYIFGNCISLSFLHDLKNFHLFEEQFEEFYSMTSNCPNIINDQNLAQEYDF